MATRPTFVGKGEGVSTGGASTFTIPYPAGLAANDLFVLDVGGGSTTNTASATGFVELATADEAVAGYKMQRLTKFATGSETGNLTVNIAAGAKKAGVLTVYRGVDTTAPFDTTSVTTRSASSSINKVTAAATSTQPDVLEVVAVMVILPSLTETGFTWPSPLTGRAFTMTTSTAASALAVGDSASTVFADDATIAAETVVGTVAGSGMTIKTLLSPVTTQSIARPSADDSLGGYTPSTGATGFAVISDGSDTTYLSSPNNPTGQVYQGGFPSVGTPASPNKNQLALRLAVSATPTTQSLVITLKEGSTVRATRTLSSPGLTTSPQWIVVTLTPAEVASITSWSDLAFTVAPTLT
jgi:hypothetical protein